MPYRGGITSIRVQSVHGESRWLPVGDNGERTEMIYDLRTDTSYAVPKADRAHQSYDFESDSLGVPLNVAGIGPVVALARSAANGDIAFVKYLDIQGRSQFDHHLSPFVLGVKRATDGRIVWCRDERCMGLTGQVVWRPGTGNLLFTTLGERANVGTSSMSGGVVDMYEWEQTRSTLRRVFHTTGQIGTTTGLYFSSSQCPVTKRYAVCVVERAADPPSLETIDLIDGRTANIFDPNSKLRQGLLVQRIPEHIEHMEWKDERGLHHTGVFLSARQTTHNVLAPPLVITSYDCAGFLRGGTGSTTPEFILWEDGFAVLCSNVDEALLAPNYRLKPVPPGQATRLEYMYDGWASAVQFLARKGVVDPRRVGISGLSFSGETVNYVVTHYPAFAAAATAGHLDFTDPIDFYIMAGIGGSLWERTVAGYGLADPRTPRGARYYEVVSDALNAGRVCTPLLVQTNEAEFVKGIQYYGALRLEKASAEVIVFPDEAHLFWQPQHLLLVQERNIDWLRFWLEHYESPEASKKARYARWGSMAREVRSSCRRPGGAIGEKLTPQRE